MENEGPVGAGFLSAISHLPHKQIAIFNAIVSQSFLILVCRRMMPRFASGSPPPPPTPRKYILRVWPDTGGNEEEKGRGRRRRRPSPTLLRLRLPFRHSTRGKQCSSMASLYRKCRGSVLLPGDEPIPNRRYDIVLNLFRDSGIANEIPIPIHPPSTPFGRVEILFHRLIYLFLFRRCF